MASPACFGVYTRSSVTIARVILRSSRAGCKRHQEAVIGDSFTLFVFGLSTQLPRARENICTTSLCSYPGDGTEGGQCMMSYGIACETSKHDHHQTQDSGVLFTSTGAIARRRRRRHDHGDLAFLSHCVLSFSIGPPASCVDPWPQNREI